MKKLRTVLWVLALVPALPVLIGSPQAHAISVAPASCGTTIALLGADLTPGSRLQVEQALGVDPSTRVLSETVADEGSTADDLVPPALFGRYAVSSALLHLLPAGSGLHVTLNAYVTLYTARAYANALLTAGVTNAAVSIAASSTQHALGTTALLSLLRAARLSCIAPSVTSIRQHLAIREFMLTQALAESIGYTAAPRLMMDLKAVTAVDDHSPAATAQSVRQTAAGLHLVIPPALWQSVVTFLGDLARSGVYASTARAHSAIEGETPSRVSVFLYPIAPKPVHGGLARGVVVSLSAGRLAVRQRDGIHVYHLAPHVSVMRAGIQRSLNAVVPGAAVHVTYGGGMATRIDVQRPAATPPPAVIQRTVEGTLAGLPAGTAPLSVRTATGIIDADPALNGRVYLDGRPSSLQALELGDRLTVTLNRQGQALRIDARSVAAPPAVSVAWPVPALGLGILLLLSALVLLFLFGQRHSGRRPIRTGAPRVLAVPIAARLSIIGQWWNSTADAKAVLAEAIGTCLLTLAALTGQGPVGVALTLAAFVYALGEISSCHLNPAVTLGLASARRLPVRTALCYIVAQLVGALAARAVAPQVAPLAGHYAAGTVIGEFLGFGFLMLTVIAVSDKYVPRSGSGVAIGAALLAGLLVSRGIVNPAIALASGRVTSPASWAPLLAALAFTGLFFLIAPSRESDDILSHQAETRVRRSA